MKAHASVVIATDNMDCFIRNFDHARTRLQRPRPESATLADWAIICDDILCSSDVGAQGRRPNRVLRTMALGTQPRVRRRRTYR